MKEAGRSCGNISNRSERCDPGKQLQSDWGEVVTEIGGVRCKVYFIVNELGYSRRFHFWCTDSADAEHTYEGMIRSLEYFGGVAREVLVDNQKSAVLQASNSGSPRFNERFVDQSEMWKHTLHSVEQRSLAVYEEVL